MATGRALRRRLVDALCSQGWIASEPVRQAFLTVARELFLPGRPLREVYRDVAIPTRFDPQGFPTSSSSQPAIMAAMLERLDLRPGQRVLEIGAGTGYNAALLKELVGARGRVVSVELDPAVAREARAALKRSGHRVRVVVGDGRDGRPDGAPYDRIVATASAAELPRPWLDQVLEGGLVELPLQLPSGIQMIPTLTRRGAGLRSVTVIAGGFMPLRGAVDEPVTPPPGLSASDGTRPLVSLFGASLGRLSSAARRRVLALALGPPRLTRLGRREPAASLTLFVSVTAPLSRLVLSFPNVGVVGAEGRSLAILGGEWARGIDRIEAWGGPEAERALLALVDDWRARGRPDGSELDIRVAFRGARSLISVRSSGARSSGARARRDGSPAARTAGRRARTR